MGIPEALAEIAVPKWVYQEKAVPACVRQWLGPEGVKEVFAIYTQSSYCDRYYNLLSQQPITWEILTHKNARGYTMLDDPNLWENFSNVVNRLAAQGEVLTKEMLLETNSEGRSWLEQAARSGSLPEVVRYLEQREEFLHAEELLEAPRKAGGILKAAAVWQDLGCLFKRELWRGENQASLQRALHAIPSEVKETIPSLHGLVAFLHQPANKKKAEEHTR